MPAWRTASTRRSYSRRRPAELLGAPFGQRRELVEEHPHVIRVAVDDVEQLVAEHRELGRRGAAGGRDAIRADHHLVHDAVVDRGEQLLLGADVVVERALAHAVRGAQLRDPGGVVALPREHLRRRVDDARRAAPSTSGCAGARHPVGSPVPLPLDAPVSAPEAKSILTGRYKDSGAAGGRAQLRRSRRRDHGRRTRHRAGVRPVARGPRRERRRQRPRRLDAGRGHRRGTGGDGRGRDRRRGRRRDRRHERRRHRGRRPMRSSMPRSRTSDGSTC